MGNIISELDSKDCFKNWKPELPPWQPVPPQKFEDIVYDAEFFKGIFNRDPKKGEDVVGLGKAGLVISCVFALAPPPTNLVQKEYRLISEAGQIMCEKDQSIGFGISMVMRTIKAANPQCKI